MTWDWFDRELASINAAIARLESETAAATAAPRKGMPPPPRPSAPAEKPRVREVPGSELKAPAQSHHSVTPPAATPPQPTASVAAPAPAALPTGRDLADPKNFGLLPPTANLEQGATGAEEYRKRLARDLAFATKVLHTSRVPAAVWREWRMFEKAVQERLRALVLAPSVVD